jgi:6-phosphogluconolactonase
MSATSADPGERKFSVYVSNAGDGTITTLDMNSAFDEPRHVQSIPVAEGNISGGVSVPMTISPDRRHLHAAVRIAPLPITSFAIDPVDGTLAPLGSGCLPGTTPYVVTDQNGRFLFSAANIGATLAVSAIDGEDRIERYARQVLHIGHKVHCITVDAKNTHVYVSSTDEGTIYQFDFDAATGDLVPSNPATVTLNGGGDPRHMVFSPDGRFLYVTTEDGGRVACFSVDPVSGNLTELPDVAMMPDDYVGGSSTADIHLTKNGRFLYASERVLNRIVAYRADQDSGALSFIEAVVNNGKPRSFAIAPDDTFMLAAAHDTGVISAYAIDAETGKLTKGVQFETGPQPSWIELI